MDPSTTMTISRKAFFSSGYSTPISQYGSGCNFALEIFILGKVNPESGLIVNLTEIDLSMKKALSDYDMKNLNFENAELHDLLDFPLARIAHSLVKKFWPLQKALKEKTESRLTHLVLTDLGSQTAFALPID